MVVQALALLLVDQPMDLIMVKFFPQQFLFCLGFLILLSLFVILLLCYLLQWLVESFSFPLLHLIAIKFSIFCP